MLTWCRNDYFFARCNYQAIIRGIAYSTPIAFANAIDESCTTLEHEPRVCDTARRYSLYFVWLSQCAISTYGICRPAKVKPTSTMGSKRHDADNLECILWRHLEHTRRRAHMFYHMMTLNNYSLRSAYIRGRYPGCVLVVNAEGTVRCLFCSRYICH